MEISGDSWGFEAEFSGGPGDGLKDEVISLVEMPPKIWWIELGEDGAIETEKLGMKTLNVIFKRMPKQGTKVAVYKINGDPADFNHEKDVVPYQHEETLLFEEYAKKYALKDYENRL